VRGRKEVEREKRKKEGRELERFYVCGLHGLQ